MSRQISKSEELRRTKEENFCLRQKINMLQNDLEKERKEKLEMIDSCLHELSGIDYDVANLEGQIRDSKELISKALEQVNLINEDVNDSTLTLYTTYSSNGRSLSAGNLIQLTSPEQTTDSALIPQKSSSVRSFQVQNPKFFKARHAEKETKRSTSSTNVHKKTETFVEPLFSLESFHPTMSSSNESPEIPVVKKRPKRRVRKANKQKK